MNWKILVLFTAIFGLMGCGSSTAPGGAEGIGDSYYPKLGNGGYDAQHYTLDLAVDPINNTLSGSCDMRAKALQPLSSFNLDFVQLTIDQIRVDGRKARYQHNERELMVNLPQDLQPGEIFTVTIAYHGSPQPVISAGMLAKKGWIHTEDSHVYVSSEVSGASTWYPVNDHPRDKASYSIRITVPRPYVVAANGLLKEEIDHGDTLTYVWESVDPMASYLVGLSIAEYVVESEKGPDGILIRNYLPPDLPDELRVGIDQTSTMIAFFDDRFGPYPFAAYGTVVVDLPDFGAMETQTLSQHARHPDLLSESTIAHELAHQWFGNSVSLVNWQDLWLKEGMGVYASVMWEEQKNGSEALVEWVKSAYVYENWSSYPPGDPLHSNLFTGTIYNRGALIFHALRLRVGDDIFFQILRAYTERFRYGNASASDFISIADEISGQDLTEFFNSWLHDKKIPPIPEMGLQP
jgi:aminopeptidase N